IEIMRTTREGHRQPRGAEVREPVRALPALHVDDRHEPVARVDGAEHRVRQRNPDPHQAPASTFTPSCRMYSRMIDRSPRPGSRTVASGSSDDTGRRAATHSATVKVEPSPGVLHRVT